MTRSSAVLTLTPAVGRPWAGGVFAGIHCVDHLIVGPTMAEPCCWTAAMDWAAGLYVNGYHDWVLPDLAELRLLVATFNHLFHEGTWWTRLTCPSSPGEAIVQLLQLTDADAATPADADQGDYHWGKQYPANAIAVRVVPLAVHQ